MTLSAIVKELFGLFVDDGSLALAILAWVGLTSLLVLWLRIDGQWMGLLLLAGLAAILIENVVRRAGRK
jgi:hypothetical protein